MALARSVFGDAIRYDEVRIRRRKWFPFHPRRYAMVPCGHFRFHPDSTLYRDDFSAEPLDWQGFFIHEMTHVWQVQAQGYWYLLLRRHPFCRYSYRLKPGWPLRRYGIEQQAEIVRHAFMLRNGVRIAGVADAATYDLLTDFPGGGMKTSSRVKPGTMLQSLSGSD